MTIKSEKAPKITEKVQDFISAYEYSGKPNVSVSSTSNISADKIREYKQLVDDGIITQEQLNEACKKGGIEVDDLNSRLEELNSNERLIGIIGEDGSKSVGTFTDSLFELADATGLSADELLTLMQAQQDGTLTNDQLAAAAEKCGMSIDDLRESISNLGEESNKSGIDRIVDGIKSISDLIFKGGDRENLFQRGILGSILEGFNRIIPPIEITKESIEILINRFRNWASSLQLSGKQMSLLRQAGQGFAAVLQFLGNTIRNFWDATSNLRTSLSNLANSIAELVLKLFGSAKDMDTAGISADSFRKICDKVAEVINKISEAIKNVNIDSLKEKFSGLSKVLDTLKSGFDWLVDKITNIDFSGGIGRAIDWLSDKFSALKESLSGFDFGKAFKSLAGGGILTLIGTKIVKALLPKKGFLDGIKEKITGVLDGIKDALSSFESGIKVDSIKKVAEAIAILAAALLILGFVNYDNAVTGLLTIGVILGVLYMALEKINAVDKAKMATLAGSMLIAAAAMLVMAIALAALAGALALFSLVAKMDTIAEGLLYMAATLAIAVVALQVMSNMSPKVLIAAAALGILAVSMLVLAGALAAFAATAKMDTIAEGLLYMAATLAVAMIALGILAQQGPMILVAALSLGALSLALLVLAGALAAFAAIATMATAGEGLALLITMLAALTIALLALSATGPLVVVAAGSLLLIAAACLILAAAVLVVGLTLPLLAVGLAALGAAIGSALTSIGEGAQNFLVSLSDALVAIGDALAEIISSIGESLGGAVASLGNGIGEAITDIIASVGKGIGEGITAISDSIGTFGDNLTNAGLGITNLGEGIRSLSGISWTSTALGIGELALAFDKLDPTALATSLTEAVTAVVQMCTDVVVAIQTAVPEMTTAADQLANAIVQAIIARSADARAAASSLTSGASRTIVMGYQSWYNAGAFLGQGLANGILSKYDEVAAASEKLAAAAAEALMLAAQIASPSKLTTRLGEYWGIGFANGIESMTGHVEDSSEELINKSQKVLGHARNLISNLLEDDFTPVVSPVLDLSSVENGLDDITSIDTPLSFNRVQAASQAGIIENQNGTGNTAVNPNMTTYQFNQYNTSPKALSRIEIYRQTKNLISMQREAASR